MIEAYRDEGTAAGHRLARRYGLYGPAGRYVEMRAASEEQLAAYLAQVRAALVRDPGNVVLQAEAEFVRLRLEDVRAALRQGQTPDPAVVDQPEVHRREISRWVPLAGLALGALALLRSL